MDLTDLCKCMEKAENEIVGLKNEEASSVYMFMFILLLP